MKKRLVIGAGQCGMKLAHKFYTEYRAKSDTELLAFSTSTEDSVGIPNKSIVQVSTEGSGKKYTRGVDIWKASSYAIDRALRPYREGDVLYFVSAGGGSGSSSIRYITDQLLRQKNRILLVMILPFGYESLPFKPNALQALSSLQAAGLIDRVSVMLFDNDKLAKQYIEVEELDDEKSVTYANLEKINDHIAQTTSFVLDMIENYHDPNKSSPFTIDELEHESVVFSNGYIGVDVRKEKPSSVKFDYGKLSDAKNIIVAKAVGTKTSDYLVQQSTGRFLDVVKKISRKAKNARMMYGIIRTDKIEDGTYIVIANNLDVNTYATKIKEKVTDSIEHFREKSEREDVLDSKETKLFDI